MEWLIITIVTVLAITKHAIIANEWTKSREPRGPFRRPTRNIRPTGRLEGEVSLNDLTPAQLERFIQNLQRDGFGAAAARQRTSRLSRLQQEEKVNWKEEGF